MLTACGSSQDDEQKSSDVEQTSISTEETDTTFIDVARVEQIIIQRCATCHSATPSDRTYRAAPSHVIFDNIEQMQRLADRIRFRVVDTQTMPFFHKTKKGHGLGVTLAKILGKKLAFRNPEAF